ncbi:MAG: redoxin domain-containing protein [Candidatus Eisenbacteria bacterium]|nr:redoxin domain-containing protein [Candidatus Eisenbacteria bacterium]
MSPTRAPRRRRPRSQQTGVLSTMRFDRNKATRRRRLVLFMLGLVAGVGLALGAASAASEEAPPFFIRSVTGRTLKLELLLTEGPILLDFWATWCKPCRKALPEIQDIHERFDPRGLTVIGISADGPRNFSKVRPFAARMGLTYPIALDASGDIQKNFRVTGLPTTVLIDTSGVIVSVRRGYRPGEGEELSDLIESILPAPAGDEPSPGSRASSPPGDGGQP